MSIDLIVPAPGESVSEVTIGAWLKKEGDWVEMDEPVAEFESDKATFTVNAEKSGKIIKLNGAVGDVIPVGTVIAQIDPSAEKPAGAAPVIAAKEEKSEAKPAVETKAKTEVKETAKPAVVSEKLITPIAAELLSEFGLDANKVNGSGSNGKITKLDALEAIVASGKTSSQASSSGGGYKKGTGREIRPEKMSNLRKTVSKRLVAAKNETAMLTTFNEVNMKPIMDLRNQYKKTFEEKHGVGLGFMSFFTRAVCLSLQEWPAVNASISNDEIIYHDFCDISIAVSAPKGLVVPIIRSAESMSLAEIEAEVKRLALKARDNKLTIDEMTGGTFTITNGGVFGSMMSTPIINPPQSAILGMHNIVERPIAENGAVVIRPMMYVALSYDHRIIDGRESVGFLVKVKTLLENPQMLLTGKNPLEAVLGF